MGEIVFLTILGLISIGLFALTATFPVNNMDTTGGAAMFPRAVIILLGILLIVRLVQIIKSKKFHAHFAFIELFQGSTGIFLLGIFLYILLFSVLGYILSTLIYSFAAVTYCYSKKYGNIGSAKAIAIRGMASIGGTLLLYWFFSYVLMVRMPEGLLGI